MVIERKRYLDKLINKRGNGLIKIITGIRRCGKSYLLFNLYKQYLINQGVKEDQIIELALDEAINARYRNPIELDKYIREKVSNKNIEYYIFIDEIQKVESIKNPYLNTKDAKIGFVDTLLGLMKISNVDIYVTGSNSRMLSSDILTDFKDRGDEVRVYPLNYKEFYDSYIGDKNFAWQEYVNYGGMPLAVTKKTYEEKSKYLKDLFNKTYISDVIERYNIQNDSQILEDVLNFVSSAIGSLTNPTKLANAFASIKQIKISSATINKYLDYFIDAFILNKAFRYDIKGKEYLQSPLKYYFVDVGLRNARLNFRQQEENHIMENIIYNELIVRGFNVDVGMVMYNYKEDNKSKRSELEIDFVVNAERKKYYIQSALNIDNPEKREQEIKSLNRVKDSFKKIVIVKDNIIPWRDEQGILYIGVQQFLLEENAIDLY